MTKVVLAEKLAALDAHWQPRVVAELNGQAVKVARVRGAFVWHKHDDVDELFWVVRGHLRIEFRGADVGTRVVELSAGELLVVPRGVEHRPMADDETEIVLFEPLGVVNTGDASPSDLTAPVDLRL